MTARALPVGRRAAGLIASVRRLADEEAETCGIPQIRQEMGGQGKPAVVQVHDPQCPACTALQRETRRALAGFDECALVYLIANIRTEEGGAFAKTHRAPHVTLLLFDAEGTLRQSLSGLRTRAGLRALFRAHHAAYGAVAS
ncbi:MAG: hypothetical protein QNJ44_02305 [Rhodobacter sp.]|nr:hypothetical protein [Rhodobacter sp.]